MICKMINNKLHYEQIYVPFGCMLPLSDDVVHGGCLGNYGSFRFHFALKQLNKRAQEKLHHDDEAITKQFYKEFPDVAKDQKKSQLCLRLLFRNTFKHTFPVFCIFIQFIVNHIVRMEIKC